MSSSAPLPPPGDFVAESRLVFKEHQTLRLSDETKGHLERIAKALHPSLPDVDRRLLQEIESEIWTCIGGYWTAKSAAAHCAADARVVEQTRLNAFAWLAAIWYEVLETGARVRVLRPPIENDLRR